MNLVFFCTRGKQADDFGEVSQRIKRFAPGIRARVFTTRAMIRPLIGGLWFSLRPTVSVEMDNRRARPRLLRGMRLVHGGINGKIDEYRLLEAAGLPVPKWTEIKPETTLNPAEWGPYVVVKPSLGQRGAYVWVHRAGRVRFKSRDTYPENHPGRDGPMIAQKFIYTGRWPVSYRVTSYFGVPVCALRYEGRRDLPPLESVDGIKRAGGGLSIVASAKGGFVELSDNPEILEIARKTHAAFPNIPSLGIDMVRDATDGTIYVAEINPGGESWLFTNDSGLEIQRQFNLDLYVQFDALDIIARRSVEIARTHAS